MISQEAAIEIARARAQARGWGLAEPLGIRVRRTWSGRTRSYEIESNPAMRGTKTRFTIDAQTGAILAEGYLPR